MHIRIIIIVCYVFYYCVSFAHAEEHHRRPTAELVYIDSNAKLMWVLQTTMSGKTRSYEDAVKWVEELSYAGYDDWRLPSKKELEAFIRRGFSIEGPVKEAFAPVDHNPYSMEFFIKRGFDDVNQYNYYWTSSNAYQTPIDGRMTSVTYKTDYVWAFRFTCGFYVEWKRFKHMDFYAWPVRDMIKRP